MFKTYLQNYSFLVKMENDLKALAEEVQSKKKKYELLQDLDKKIAESNAFTDKEKEDINTKMTEFTLNYEALCTDLKNKLEVYEFQKRLKHISEIVEARKRIIEPISKEKDCDDISDVFAAESEKLVNELQKM